MFEIIRNRLGLEKPSPEEEQSPDNQEWPYEWTEESVEHVQRQPIISHGHDPHSNGQTFAGPLARDMMESHQDDPDTPLWVGVGTRRGRHASIRKSDLFKHTAIYGTTGGGKSTLGNNALKQMIDSGSGAVIIDPKGDDSRELLQIIDDDRLDDVVWIEPSSAREYVTGFNFLDIGLDPDDPMYDLALDNVVTDLVSMIGIDDYWGPRMDGVTKTLIRATSTLPYNFSLHDLYYILESEANRERFAEIVGEENLKHLSYTEKIAQMDDDDLDAILRRMKDWVENLTALQIISFRDTHINFEDIVEQDKILIVRLGRESDDLKRMVGTAVLRRLWSTIRARADMFPEDRSPFYLFIDEFHKVASNDAGIASILAESRSFKLACVLATQYPGQIPDEVRTAMENNCNTTLSFKVGGMKDSRLVSKMLDIDQQTILKEAPYHIWMTSTLKESRETSDAYRVYTLPPYPALRSLEEVDELIEQSIRRYGRQQKSLEELSDELLINGGEGVIERSDTSTPSEIPSGDRDANPTPDSSDDRGVLYDDEGDLAAETRCAIFTGILEASRHYRPPTNDESSLNGEGYVPLKFAAEPIRRHLTRETGLESGLENPAQIWRYLIQQLPISDVPRVDTDSDTWVRVSEQAQTEIFSVGLSGSGGGSTHAMLLRDAFDCFVDQGLSVAISAQDGDRMPDGYLDPTPLDGMYDEDTWITQLTDGETVPIEAECSTGLSKKGQTVLNLADAVERDQRCLFIARERAAENVWSLLTETPACARSIDDNGEVWFYNHPRPLTIGGKHISRGGSKENRWYRTTNGQYELRDSTGVVHARFEEPGDIFTDAEAYSGDGGEWQVYPPVIPELHFESGVPSRQAWNLLQLDSDGDVRIYKDGERRPLFDTNVETDDPLDRDENTDSNESNDSGTPFPGEL